MSVNSKMEKRAFLTMQVLKASGRQILREGAWILGCLSLASLGCLSEYGCSTVPFFTISLYALTGTIRLFLYWYVRRLSR